MSHGEVCTHTADREFDRRLADLAAYARSVALADLAAVLEMLAEARGKPWVSLAEVREAAERAVDVDGPGDGPGRTKFRDDPQFPPPGWTGRKPKND